MRIQNLLLSLFKQNQRDMPVVNPTKIIVQDEISNEEQKTQSGIIIPGSVKSPSMRGKILFKGDGLKDMPLVHKVGDIALYNPRAGQEFVWDDKKYRIMDAGEIFLSGDI